LIELVAGDLPLSDDWLSAITYLQQVTQGYAYATLFVLKVPVPTVQRKLTRVESFIKSKGLPTIEKLIFYL
jgi:hypothetical protein